MIPMTAMLSMSMLWVLLSVCVSGLDTLEPNTLVPDTYSVGFFRLQVLGWVNPNMVVTDSREAWRGEEEEGMEGVVEEEGVVWRTVVGEAFVRLGNASMSRPPILNGNYQLEEETEYLSDVMTVDWVRGGDLGVRMGGRLLQREGEGAREREAEGKREEGQRQEQGQGLGQGQKQEQVQGREVGRYDLYFYVDRVASKRVQFNLTVTPHTTHHPTLNPGSGSTAGAAAGAVGTETAAGAEAGTKTQTGALLPRTFLTFWERPDSGFYGFGESFSHFDLAGRRVPVLVSEQGVGRGLEPITAYLNTEVAEGVGGSWHTTYAPKPLYTTNHNKTFHLSNSEVSFFDLTRSSEGFIQIEVWSWRVQGSTMHTHTLLEAVEVITGEITGRQGPLPMWSQLGAVVGLEGGTANVSSTVERLYKAGVPLAGVWLQDWVGLQHSWDGDRLIWNWELNRDWYPEWDVMVGRWAKRGTRVLTYMSPFFSNPSANSNSTTAFRHNYFQEGIAGGYFVQNREGGTYLMYSLSIQFAMLDPTNPAAVAWMTHIISSASLGEAHSSGWMCDFGEYLPFDAVLHSGESASSYHNKYPQEWGRLTQQAIASTGADDTVYFMRSGWLQSPSVTPLFWLGDQLVSWDGDDGLRSVLVGALSSGLSGYALTHSDIGGYTVETLGPPDSPMYFVRTPELLQRWSEMSAFGFALFRTHVGSSTTQLDAQVYDSPSSMAHFAEFASIFAHLAPLRTELSLLSAEKGYPLIRPLCMHYAYDKQVWGITEAYLVGEELLVAPVLHQGATSVRVYFPLFSGPWVHVWSGAVIDPGAKQGQEAGLTLTVPAPMGFPPVFYKQGSVHGALLRAFVRDRGYAEAYRWEHGLGMEGMEGM